MPDLNDELLQELLQAFRYEAAEHLETLNNALLQFERTMEPEQRQAHIQDAFRAAHSLKGAARAVSMDSIQSIAHAMENVFQSVRDEGVELKSEDCDLLYDALDNIQQTLSGKESNTNAIEQRLKAINGHTPTTTNGAVVVDEPDFAAAQSEQPHESVASDETIRVSLRKLDDLMAEVGELLVTRISTAQRLTETRQLNQQLQDWSKSWSSIKNFLKRHEDPQLTDLMFQHADVMQSLMERFNTLQQDTHRDVTRLDLVTINLQDKVRQVRMIPFSVHSLMLERVVRDAARVQNKNVNFEIIGSETELDKRILEQLKSPLIHLLRNAVGHGIEPPEERGEKPPRGTIKLKIHQRGSEVHLQITDDGRGFQQDKIKAAYEQRYGATSENPINLAFMPGVTTSTEINEIAGRGIGLDVVRSLLEKVHGRFTVQSEAGEGTTITLIVPTSLAITRMLIIIVDHEQYALPLMAVEKIVIAENITTVSGKPMLKVDGHNLPLISLAAIIGKPTGTLDDQPMALIVAIGDQKIAILVEDVLTEIELAVKPIGFPVKRVRNITGAALMGNGDPVIVLNPADFLQTYRSSSVPIKQAAQVAQQPEKPVISILVVDDSITTRTLERNILEAAGYYVVTATNGVEALNRLAEHTVDVVVSDIEMPAMDGFELTQQIRSSDKLSNLPIILVTSLEREEHRERGMKSGANAYIVKRGFDQAELLTAIEQLV